VKSNVIDLLKADKLNKPVYLKMNPTKHNLGELNELSGFFEKLGGKPENAIIGTTGFNLPAEASKEEIEIFFDNVVSEGMDEHLRFTYDCNKNIISKSTKCSFLVPTIKWDGKVTICCHDQLSRLNLGDAFQTPLKEIIESRKYRIIEAKGKRRMLAFCKNCN